MLEMTNYQRKLMIKILKNYKDLRKSHFYEIRNSVKAAKICDDLVIVDGWIEELESDSSNG